MPIKINLLAESQYAEDQRRRDPVKRGIWIAGFLVFLVVIYIAKLQLDVWAKQNELKLMAERWAKLEPEFKKVTDNKKEVDAVQDKISLLDQLHTNRFLWGNLFNALQNTMVPNIQVTHLQGDQSFARVEANPKQHISAGTQEKITLIIAARDLSQTEEADPSYAKFKRTLSDYGYFQKKLGKDGFLIDGNISQPMPDPADPGKQFRSFSLVAHFPEIQHD